MDDKGNGGLLCPACGYDLRGATTDQCSECGVVLDRTTLDHSSFPWVYRATTGRAKAFLKTVWQITIDAKRLRYEAARAQSPGDAAAFRRWVAIVVIACFASLVCFAQTKREFVRQIVLTDSDKPGWSPGGGVSGAALDARLPWSAGVTLPMAAYLYATLFAVLIVNAAGRVFRARATVPRADATVAIARYVVAPLVWLLPAVVLLVSVEVFLTLDRSNYVYRGSAPFVLMIGVGVLCLLVSTAGTMLRTGQWRARVTHGGFGTGLLAAGELSLYWLLAAVIALGVVPWCVGLVFVLVDSLLV